MEPEIKAANRRANAVNSTKPEVKAANRRAGQWLARRLFGRRITDMSTGKELSLWEYIKDYIEDKTARMV